MQPLVTPRGETSCKVCRWLLGTIIPGREPNNWSHYFTRMGFVFIFNTIVGTGALALPNAYNKISLYITITVIVSLAVFSYMMVTFIVESMSNANIYRSYRHLVSEGSQREVFALHDMNSDIREDSSYVLLGETFTLRERLEKMPLSYFPTTSIWYNISDTFELGDLMSLFFSNIGRIIFYIVASVYLYAELIISSSAAAKDLCDSLCNYENNDIQPHINNQTSNMTSKDITTKCWQWTDLTPLHAYRLFVIGCILIFGSFTIFNTPLHETKVWKIITICYRVCVLIFVCCTPLKLCIKEDQRPLNIYGLTCVFAAFIYTLRGFLDRLCTNNCVLRIFISIVLALIPAFALIGFQKFCILFKIADYFSKSILLVPDYFSKFFQFFTLSASFSIIAMTLHNNLQCIFLDRARRRPYNLFIRRILFPIMTLLPPLLICFSESLIIFSSYVLSYVGTVIQYFVPVVLVYTARKKCSLVIVNSVTNNYKSPFYSSIWLVIVLVWALLWISAVTYIQFFSTK